jgi:hypothetical protein
LELGAVHDTNASEDAPNADTPVGAGGAIVVRAVTGFDGLEAGPLPAELDAVSWDVYVLPACRPVIVVVVAGGAPLTCVLPAAAPPV